MNTVAAIAARAFDKIGAALSDVVKPATLTHTEQGAYNPGTGEYDVIITTADGRAVFDTTTAVEDMFPAYVVGPSDLLVWLEGHDFSPLENDGVEIDGQGYTVKAVGDVAGAGAVYGCMVVAS